MPVPNFAPKGVPFAVYMDFIKAVSAIIEDLNKRNIILEDYEVDYEKGLVSVYTRSAPFRPLRRYDIRVYSDNQKQQAGGQVDEDEDDDECCKSQNCK